MSINEDCQSKNGWSPCTHHTLSQLTRNPETHHDRIDVMDLQSFITNHHLQSQSCLQVIKMYESHQRGLNMPENKSQISQKKSNDVSGNPWEKRSKKAVNVSKNTKLSKNGKKKSQTSLEMHKIKTVKSEKDKSLCKMFKISQNDYYGSGQRFNDRKVQKTTSKVLNHSAKKYKNLKQSKGNKIYQVSSEKNLLISNFHRTETSAQHSKQQNKHLQPPHLNESSINEYFCDASTKNLKSYGLADYSLKQSLIAQIQHCMEKWDIMECEHQREIEYYEENKAKKICEKQMHRLRKIHAIERESLRKEIQMLKEKILLISEFVVSGSSNHGNINRKRA